MSLWREEAVPVLPVPVRLRIGSGSIGSGSVRPRSWFRFIVFRFGLGSVPVHAVPVRARLLLIFLSPDDVHGQTSLPCCTGTCVSSSLYCTRYSTQLIESLLNSLNPYSTHWIDFTCATNVLHTATLFSAVPKLNLRSSRRPVPGFTRHMPRPLSTYSVAQP